MRKWIALLVTLILMLAANSLAIGGTTANQTVTYKVQAIDQISVSGDPGPLIINTATAGQQPTDATDTSTTYAITTNGTGKKITGAIDTAMPTGVTLKINLLAPTGATSAGNVVLGIIAADLVTGISQVAESGLTITYTLSATVAATPGSGTRTVTLTIVDGP